MRTVILVALLYSGILGCANAENYALSGVWVAERPSSMNEEFSLLNMYLLIRQEENSACGIFYETWDDRFAPGSERWFKVDLDYDEIFLDFRPVSSVQIPDENYVRYLDIRQTPTERLLARVRTIGYLEYLDVPFRRTMKVVPSLSSRKDYTHYPVEELERFCGKSPNPSSQGTQRGEAAPLNLDVRRHVRADL